MKKNVYKELKEGNMMDEDKKEQLFYLVQEQ